MVIGQRQRLGVGQRFLEFGGELFDAHETLPKGLNCPLHGAVQRSFKVFPAQATKGQRQHYPYIKSAYSP
jgi:hypothetical protein